MNPKEILKVIETKQWDRIIAICQFEKNLKQIKLGEWL